MLSCGRIRSNGLHAQSACRVEASVILGDQESKRLIQPVSGAAFVVVSPFRNQQTWLVEAARESQQEERPTENVHQ